MRVGNQEQICVKLDRESVYMLKDIALETGIKKNRIINEAIKYYFFSSVWR